jgi:hypothetical protein
MRREVPGRIAMQPEKNFIRGLLGNYVFSDRPNLRCDLGSRAASRCVLRQYSGHIADAGFDGSSNCFYLARTRGEIPPRAAAVAHHRIDHAHHQHNLARAETITKFSTKYVLVYILK